MLMLLSGNIAFWPTLPHPWLMDTLYVQSIIRPPQRAGWVLYEKEPPFHYSLDTLSQHGLSHAYDKISIQKIV